MMTDSLYDDLLAQLTQAWQGLPDKPQETPALTLSALWSFASGQPEAAAGRPNLEAPLAAAAADRLKDLVAQRLAGKPLSYLLGRQQFMGLELLAGPEAMIPRQETEILGRAALEILQGLAQARGAVTVVDVCTGSGNVALALAWHEPRCRVFGADISEAAVGLAERNAQRLGLAERAQFRSGDFLAPFELERFGGQVDLLTCNPPYISTARADKMAREISGFEPRLAFDGGPFGIRLLARLVKEAPPFLTPGGWVACEVGLGQGEAMLRMFQKSPAYRQVQTFKDEHGEVRVLAAQM